MRVKVQVRNAAGIYEDMLLDPEQGNVLAMEFMPADMMYISRRAKEHTGIGWLHIGAMPMRIKTSVSMGGRGEPQDLLCDRGAGDWICIELMPEDLHRLARVSGGSSSQYPRIWATRKSAKFTDAMRDKFMADWPELSQQYPNAFPDDMCGGAPAYMRGREREILAFNTWVNDWPPVFHASDKAPVAKLVGPNGRPING